VTNVNRASPNQWMIYGAYGYTGVLVAEEAVRRGHRPLLAGRSRAKLDPVAERFGLEALALDLSDGPGLARALEGVDLVFHAAGPFVDTSQAMVRACLEAGTNYVDITGEVAVFRDTLSYDAAAKEKGVVLMSGVGFDVVPTDCLAAHVSQKLPGATELEIAIAGLGHLSAGTAKSMFHGMLEGGLVRRNGKLVGVPTGKGGRRIRFWDRERSVLPIPWGDLETAYKTTGIPDITTYMAFPRRLAAAAESTWRLGAAAAPIYRAVLGAGPIKRAIEEAIEARVKGPDETMRGAARAQVWAKAIDAAGRSVEAWLETVDGYSFTAVAGVRAVERILATELVGALTPALAFGADFVLEIAGTVRHDAAPGLASA
jgi:short subunit dehydrogenase-like uncharacterized protein